jgi:putative DNA primase/helicase
MAAARDLSARLQQGKLPESFTARDLYRKGWAGPNSPDKVRRVLEVLKKFGWVREVAGGEGSEGRPKDLWAINPDVRPA